MVTPPGVKGGNAGKLLSCSSARPRLPPGLIPYQRPSHRVGPIFHNIPGIHLELNKRQSPFFTLFFATPPSQSCVPFKPEGPSCLTPKRTFYKYTQKSPVVLVSNADSWALLGKRQFSWSRKGPRYLLSEQGSLLHPLTLNPHLWPQL